MDQQTRDWIILAIVGLVAGYLASIVVGGSGLIRYLVSGVIGAFIGPLLLSALKVDLGIGNLLVRQVATATIGAIVVVFLARLIG